MTGTQNQQVTDSANVENHQNLQNHAGFVHPLYTDAAGVPLLDRVLHFLDERNGGAL